MLPHDGCSSLNCVKDGNSSTRTGPLPTTAHHQPAVTGHRRRQAGRQALPKERGRISERLPSPPRCRTGARMQGIHAEAQVDHRVGSHLHNLRLHRHLIDFGHGCVPQRRPPTEGGKPRARFELQRPGALPTHPCHPGVPVIRCQGRQQLQQSRLQPGASATPMRQRKLPALPSPSHTPPSSTAHGSRPAPPAASQTAPQFIEAEVGGLLLTRFGVADEPHQRQDCRELAERFGGAHRSAILAQPNTEDTRRPKTTRPASASAGGPSQRTRTTARK